MIKYVLIAVMLLTRAEASEMRQPRTEGERAALQDELPRPPRLDGSPSAEGHFAAAKQASTWLAGPETSEVDVDLLDLNAFFGTNVGTSPWHVASTHRYADESAITLWGASLTSAYRILVNGDRFEALDLFEINKLPTSIPWNLMSLDDGRVLVPDPNGRRVGEGRRTLGPTLLVLHDDPDGSGRLDQEITLQRTVVLSERDLRRLAVRAAAHG